MFLVLNAIFIVVALIFRHFSYDWTLFWALFYLVTAPTLFYYLFISKDNLFTSKRENGRISGSLFWIAEAFVLAYFTQAFYLSHHMIPTKSMAPYIMPGDRFLVDMVSPRFNRISRGQIYIFNSPIFVVSHKDTLCKRVVGMPGDEIDFTNEFIKVNNFSLPRNYSSADVKLNKWRVPKRGDKLAIESISIRVGKEIYSLEDIRGDSTILNRVINNINTAEVISSAFTLNGKANGPIASKRTIKMCLMNDSITLNEDFFFFLGDNTDNSKDSRFFGFISSSDIRGRAIIRIFPFNRVGLVNRD